MIAFIFLALVLASFFIEVGGKNKKSPKGKPSDLRVGTPYGTLATAADRARKPMSTNQHIRSRLKQMADICWGFSWSTCNDSKVCKSCASHSGHNYSSERMKTKALEFSGSCTNKNCRCDLSPLISKPQLVWE